MAASSDNPLATPAAPRVHEQPFGDNKLTIPTGAPDTDANHYAFLDTDKETATDHADFRQYSNAQGRWMAPDPYDGSYDPSNPQSLNRYVYAMNSPASDLDPSGLWSLQASAVCSFCSSIWNAIRNIFSSVGDEDGGSSGGGGGGGGGTIDVNSPYMQYNDPMNYVNPTTTVWGPSSFGSGGGGVGGNAPSNGKCLGNVNSFVNAHLADATTLANSLGNGVTPTEVLAVAGNETGYGGGFAQYGNYFGLHGSGPAGTYYTTGTPSVAVAKFPVANGFLLSGQVFVSRVGPYMTSGLGANPLAFFTVLNKHGYATGNSGYPAYMTGTDKNRGPYTQVSACMAGHS